MYGKKKARFIVTGFVFAMLVAACVGGLCSRFRKNTETQTAAEPLRAVIFSSEPNNGVSSTISHVAVQLKKELEGDEKVYLSSHVVELGHYRDLEYKVNTAIDLDSDVLILSGSSVRDLEMLKKLKDAGIWLIFVDGDCPEGGRDAYVGTDNQAAGRLAARTALEKTGGGKAVILSAPQIASNKTRSREQRREGIMSLIAEEEGSSIEILTEKQCSPDSLVTKAEVKELLLTSPETGILFCLDSASGIAAAAALKELQKTEEVYVICFDLPMQVEEELTSGGIDAAVVQNFEECGCICAKLLREMAEDSEAVRNRMETVDCRIVTAKDVGEPDGK